jgi:hypothetical protein
MKSGGGQGENQFYPPNESLISVDHYSWPPALSEPRRNGPELAPSHPKDLSKNHNIDYLTPGRKKGAVTDGAGTLGRNPRSRRITAGLFPKPWRETY